MTITVVRVITRLNIGGPAQHVVLLGHLLPNYGFNEILVAGSVDLFEGDMAELARRKGIHLISVPTLRNAAGLAENARAFLQLYHIFRHYRPTIVHLHLLKARAFGGLAARLARVPIVIETFHGTLFSGHFHPRATRLLVFAERILARLFDVVVTVSETVAEEIIQQGVAVSSKVVTIPIGLELDRFRNAVDPMLRAELGVDPKTPLIGAVSRLVPVKGLRYLIEATPRLRQLVPTVQVVIVGDGPERPALEQLAESIGVGKQVHFLGWRRDLHRVYPDLDVVVLPSLSEGTPVSLIEAMAAGRAVVATRVGGIPDVISDGRNGLLVQAKDEEGLVDRVGQLLRDSVFRERLGRAAQLSVFSRFTAERLAGDVADLYRRVLEPGRRRGLTHRASRSSAGPRLNGSSSVETSLSRNSKW